MNRAMLLACFLFLPHRSVLPKPVLNADGSIDEAAMITPGQMASIARRGGATAELVAAQLGHASTHVTNRAYIQRRASEAADSAAVVAALGNHDGTHAPDGDPNVT